MTEEPEMLADPSDGFFRDLRQQVDEDVIVDDEYTLARVAGHVRQAGVNSWMA